MTPAPRPFSGDTEDAPKSQNPLAQSARTQTLIPLMMGFLGMYCLTLDRPMNHLINCVVTGRYDTVQHLELCLQKEWGGMSKHFKIGESFTGGSPFPYPEVIDDGPDLS